MSDVGDEAADATYRLLKEALTDLKRSSGGVIKTLGHAGNSLFGKMSSCTKDLIKDHLQSTDTVAETENEATTKVHGVEYTTVYASSKDDLKTIKEFLDNQNCEYYTNLKHISDIPNIDVVGINMSRIRRGPDELYRVYVPNRKDDVAGYIATIHWSEDALESLDFLSTKENAIKRSALVEAAMLCKPEADKAIPKIDKFVPGKRTNLNFEMTTIASDRKAAILTDVLDKFNIPYELNQMPKSVTIEIAEEHGPYVKGVIDQLCETVNGMRPDRFSNLESLEVNTKTGELPVSKTVLQAETLEKAAVIKEGLSDCGIAYEAVYDHETGIETIAFDSAHNDAILAHTEQTIEKFEEGVLDQEVLDRYSDAIAYAKNKTFNETPETVPANIKISEKAKREISNEQTSKKSVSRDISKFQSQAESLGRANKTLERTKAKQGR